MINVMPMVFSLAFATMNFKSEGFHSRLNEWAAAGGIDRCSADETLGLCSAQEWTNSQANIITLYGPI